MVRQASSKRHTIRLRGPWGFEPISRTRLQPDGSTCEIPGELPVGGTVRLPADWSDLFGDRFFGRVRFSRPFGKPTGIEPHDAVELVFSGVGARAGVFLNDLPLGRIDLGSGAARFDVRAQLRSRNRLVVEVELPEETAESPALPRGAGAGQPAGILGEVTLEITTHSA